MSERVLGFFAHTDTETWVERRDIPPTRQPASELGWRWSHRTWSWWERIR